MSIKNRPTWVLLQILEHRERKKECHFAILELLARATKMHQLWRLYYCAVTSRMDRGLKGKILWKILAGRISQSNLQHVLYAAEEAGLSRICRKVKKRLAQSFEPV